MRIDVTRGLNLTVAGIPEQRVDGAPPIKHVAVLGADYAGIKPSLHVRVGDRVSPRDVLFTDRLDSRLRVTAPGCGVITAIRRGRRRSLTAVVLRLEGNERSLFARHSPGEISRLTATRIRQQLLESGLWMALRSRPFNKIPKPNAQPRWLFVTAMDTNPLAANPMVVVAPAQDAFLDGLGVLSRLGAETVFLCQAPGVAMPLPEQPANIRRAEFAGPHPAGLPGTHIDLLCRPTIGAEAWHINYQDVIAVGKLFRSGEVFHERIVAVGGDAVRRPRLLRTRLGANLSELLQNEAADSQLVLSGSVLSGRIVAEDSDYLGRFDLQACAFGASQNNARPSLLGPLGRWRRHRGLLPATSLPVSGSAAGILPVEAFERVWPHAAPPAPLLRALLARDGESAESLGCLALAEEDLALLSVVCPAQQDYGYALRQTLDALEED